MEQCPQHPDKIIFRVIKEEAAAPEEGTADAVPDRPVRQPLFFD